MVRRRRIGVNIFFVLSGYLITSLLLGEYEKTGGLRRGMFYVRRALRLYPALAVMLIVTLILGHVSIKAALVAASYTTDLFNVFGRHGVPPYGRTWSLSLEEQFYLIRPLLLPLFIRMGRRTSVSILMILAIGSATWAQLAVNTVIDKNGSISVGVFNPLWQAHGLLIGCALALAIRHRLVSNALLLTNAGLVVCIVIAIAASITVSRHWVAGWNLASELAAAAAIAGLRDQAVGVGRLFRLRPVLWVGERSYAIYLWHYPLIFFALERGYGKGGVLVAVALTGVAAALSWRFVEQPCLRLKSRFEPVMPRHAAPRRPVSKTALARPLRPGPAQNSVSQHSPRLAHQLSNPAGHVPHPLSHSEAPGVATEPVKYRPTEIV
jgi:peptidoglycan/LPS O-acetylase OafA/YrhL